MTRDSLLPRHGPSHMSLSIPSWHLGCRSPNDRANVGLCGSLFIASQYLRLTLIQGDGPPAGGGQNPTDSTVIAVRLLYPYLSSLPRLSSIRRYNHESCGEHPHIYGREKLPLPDHVQSIQSSRLSSTSWNEFGHAQSEQKPTSLLSEIAMDGFSRNSP
jgi:hypothetical protein